MKYKDAIRGSNWVLKGVIASESKLLLVRSHPSRVKVSCRGKAFKFIFEGKIRDQFLVWLFKFFSVKFGLKRSRPLTNYQRFPIKKNLRKEWTINLGVLLSRKNCYCFEYCGYILSLSCGMFSTTYEMESCDCTCHIFYFLRHNRTAKSWDKGTENISTHNEDCRNLT